METVADPQVRKRTVITDSSWQILFQVLMIQEAVRQHLDMWQRRCRWTRLRSESTSTARRPPGIQGRSLNFTICVRDRSIMASDGPWWIDQQGPSRVRRSRQGTFRADLSGAARDCPCSLRYRGNQLPHLGMCGGDPRQVRSGGQPLEKGRTGAECHHQASMPTPTRAAPGSKVAFGKT